MGSTDTTKNSNLKLYAWLLKKAVVH